MVGCQRDPLSEVENLTARGDYQTALGIVENLPPTSLSVASQQAFLEFVSGDQKKAWEKIMLIKRQWEKEEAQKVLWEASQVMVREKSRVREVIPMWDTLLTWSPELRAQVLALGWQRGVEYLGMSGDAGWVMFNFLQRYDPIVLGRLQAYNPALANRFAELSRIHDIVLTLNQRLATFMVSHNRAPERVEELLKEGEDGGLPSGWRWVITSPSEGPKVVAMAGPQRPAGVPLGSVVSP